MTSQIKNEAYTKKCSSQVQRSKVRQLTERVRCAVFVEVWRHGTDGDAREIFDEVTKLHPEFSVIFGDVAES